MCNHSLAPLSIADLLGEDFHVPDYQRGYRWTPRQVSELLHDVLTFIQGASGEFYCLQPIVVARNGAMWDLIDGQQRLTTIYLVLRYFEAAAGRIPPRPGFSLRYQTRDDSAHYLQTLAEADRGDNPDYFHMYEAYRTITDWFCRRAQLLPVMKEAFLHKVKVIWYEVNATDRPVEIFQRLNIGKIPLTNAELVKGLFLRRGNFKGDQADLLYLRQTAIAMEWDEIERRLQDDAFWYFLNNRRLASNRIDFLLQLHARHIEVTEAVRNDPSCVFLAFSQRLDHEGADPRDEWARVKRLFQRLDEWYRDRHCYHLIGFLIASGDEITAILDLATGIGKSAFRRALKQRILARVLGPRQPTVRAKLEAALTSYLDELDYEDKGDYRRIKQTLLLFNIATLLASDKVRTTFPFDAFKEQAWDIEHVRAVQSSMPNAVAGAKAWLSTMLDYATGSGNAAAWDEERLAAGAGANADLCLRAQDLLAARTFEINEFETLYKIFIERYDASLTDPTDNGIGNLTLLDAGTNRSYKNAVFPVKRRTLIALDKSGTFVPLCTKNVFLKYYSPKIDRMFVWTREDANAHRTAMRDTLLEFFLEEEPHT